VLTIRLYISVLALVFLISALLTRGIGVWDGTVVVCALLYLILDTREELRAVRALEEELDLIQ
jgi:hypothetical protein